MAFSPKKTNWFLLVALMAGLLGGAPIVAQTLMPGATTQSFAEPAAIVPDQTFKTTGGATINLHQFRGRHILVHFWASWCPPCVKEFPLLIDAARKNPNIVVIAISVDSRRSQMEDFLSEVEGATTLANVYHVLDQRYEIKINNTRVRAYPETFVLNPDLTLDRHVKGGLDWRKISFN